jgi:hypothetical protein
MSNELFCPKHGPYPASYGTCPWCVQEMGGRPPAPTPLSQEETHPGMPVAGRAYSDDDATIPPGQVGRRPQGGASGGEDETQPPLRGGRGGLEEDATILPARKTKRLLDSDALPGDEEIDETVLDREDSSMMGWLIVKRSPYMRRGHMLKIRPGAVIGRSPKSAHIIVDDDKVSGIHARIQVKDERFVLIDLGSANGTWVNSQEVASPTPLKQDDEIKIGDTIFVLKTL